MVVCCCCCFVVVVVVVVVAAAAAAAAAVGCLTSQRQSGRRICLDYFTCCHTEVEVADQTCYLTQSQYTDTRQT